MRYITRVEKGNSKLYRVRLSYGKSLATQKSFADSLCGGKRKALQAARAWRDKQVKISNSPRKKMFAYDKNRSRCWGKGWHEIWDTRGQWSYLHIRVKYMQKRTGKEVRKSFSVDRYGYDRAVELAEGWIKLKRTGKL